MTTVRREVFPGVIHLVENEMQNLSTQELLTRLRRAAKLYVDPAVRGRDPIAIKAIGHHILSYVNELRRRGYTITNHGDTFIIHQAGQVELREGELVDEWSLKRRIYWAVSDAMHLAEKRGDNGRRVELFRALTLFYKHWRIKAVSRQNRKIAFGDEPGMEMK